MELPADFLSLRRGSVTRQGEQRPVEIISYMGYSPPKCTCNDNQTHSSKFMILLECLHVMDENVTHPIPYPESSPTPSHMQVAKYELLSFFPMTTQDYS